MEEHELVKKIRESDEQATVQGFLLQVLPKLGLQKDLLPDGYENE